MSAVYRLFNAENNRKYGPLLTYLLIYLRQRRHCIETVGTPVLRHSREKPREWE